jgi:hypothetical protein
MTERKAQRTFAASPPLHFSPASSKSTPAAVTVSSHHHHPHRVNELSLPARYSSASCGTCVTCQQPSMVPRQQPRSLHGRTVGARFEGFFSLRNCFGLGISSRVMVLNERDSGVDPLCRRMIYKSCTVLYSTVQWSGNGDFAPLGVVLSLRSRVVGWWRGWCRMSKPRMSGQDTMGAPVRRT